MSFRYHISRDEKYVDGRATGRGGRIGKAPDKKAKICSLKLFFSPSLVLIICLIWQLRLS
jgi:hypothetical protein